MEYTEEEAKEAKQQYNDKIIQSQKSEFLYIYDNYDTILVTGRTGCGKSSYIPVFITEEHKDHRILICQPRKLSVTGQCKRISQITGYKICKEIGYMMGQEYFAFPINKIIIATNGTAFNYIIKNYINFDTIIIDEIHELNQQAQQLLALLIKLQPIFHFRLILMSATANIQLLRSQFKNIAHFELEGSKQQQRYIVKVSQADSFVKHNGKNIPLCKIPNQPNEKKLINVAMMQCVKILLTKQEYGDILVFLPGMDQMKNFNKDFPNVAKQYDIDNDQYELIFFHAAFSQTYKRKFNQLDVMKKNIDYQIVIEEDDGTKNVIQIEDDEKIFRRIILATNVCETSVTIPSLRFVVDTCLCKKKIGNTLKVVPVSKDIMLQRKGRVGRCQDGEYIYCLSTKAVENLQETLQDEPDEETVDPLIINQALFGIDLVQNVQKINGQITQQLINKSVNQLLQYNVIMKDKNNNIKATYCGFEACKELGDIQFLWSTYISSQLNQQLGQLITQIDTVVNAQIFMFQLELTEKTYSKDYLFYLAPLGYQNFVKETFEKYNKNKKYNFSQLLKRYGRDIILDNYDWQTINSLIVLYWRRRFPVPTGLPTDEEKEWCQKLGLSRDGLQYCEFKYIQFMDLTQQEINQVDLLTFRQYYMIDAETLNERLKPLKSINDPEKYEQMHEQLWNQFVQEYQQGQYPSLAKLAQQITGPKEVNDICKLQVVSHLVQNKKPENISLAFEEMKDDQNIYEQIFNEIDQYCFVRARNINQINLEQLKTDLQKEMNVQLELQVQDSTIFLLSQNLKDQLSIFIQLSQRRQNQLFSQYNLQSNIIKDGDLQQLKYVICGPIVQSIYKLNSKQKQSKIAISCNGIPAFLSYILLLKQNVQIKLLYENENSNNLTNIQIQQGGNTLLNYQFQQEQNQQLDDLMIQYLEIVYLVNYYNYNQIKQNIATNKLEIDQDYDDNKVQQFYLCEKMKQHCINSNTFKINKQYVLNDVKKLYKNATLRIFDLFRQVDITYQQMQIFNNREQQNLQQAEKYQLSYNPVVYRNLNIE